MIQKISISILAIIFSFNAMAQKNVFLTVKHKLGANSFAFNQAATNNLNNNLSISRIDYYMSNFKIIYDGGQILSLPSNVIILVKGSNNVVKSLGSYNVTNVEGITFSIGVPQSLNHTDPATYPSSNPLAPQSPSMQWGWTAGYRFVAIEGKAGANLTTTYQMHGLGDANYFSQTKMAAGIVSGNDITINLDADYTQALKGINVTLGPIDHGVDATDLTVLKNFRDFVFAPGAGMTTSVTSLTKETNISLYPNPSSTGEISIKNSDLNSTLSHVDIMDVTGRTLLSYQLQNTMINKINVPLKGMFFVVLKTTSGESFLQKIILD